MSRLLDSEDSNLVGRLNAIKIALNELKTTPQITSSSSGVQSYLYPKSNDWQNVTWTNHLGVTVQTDKIQLLPTPGFSILNRVRITCEFKPRYQKLSLIRPYLSLLLDNTLATTGFYDLNDRAYGLEYVAPSATMRTVSYQRNDTDFSLEAPVYTYSTLLTYSTLTPSHSPLLQILSSFHASDMGDISINVTTYKDF